MENKIDCKTEKTKFFGTLTKIIVVCITILVIISLQYQTQKNKNKLIETFKNGKDLVCNTKVISLKNGYLYDEKGKTVSDGINMFRIENCSVKDL